MKRNYCAVMPSGKFKIVFLFIIFACFIQQAQSYKHSHHYPKFDGKDLHDNNWKQMLEGEWMVQFYTPLSITCRRLEPAWLRFTNAASDLNINIARIDVTTSISLRVRFSIVALPTIMHVKDGEFRYYSGSADSNTLVRWIEQKKWRGIEPISSWQHPNSLKNSVLIYFLKLSFIFKYLNHLLHTDYGLPMWLSYGFFAIGTTFLGLVLGVILGGIVYFLTPSNKLQRQQFHNARNQSDDDDDIEDIQNLQFDIDADQSEADC